MKMVTNKDIINKIFDRGIVKEILPSKEALLDKLFKGERLRIYIGADPTSTSLHLSHAKNYMFLEELRKLGHQVIVLVGDFTAQIGDPTGESVTRKQLTVKEIKENVNDWLRQIKPLMDFNSWDNPPKVMYNSKWLSKLSFKNLIPLAANFTVQQMLERDMFEKRINNETPIYLHEFFYPLMQGYDSVAMDVDVELCGTDQTFNALVGRTLQKRINNKDKFVVAVNLMENPKTGELMSKSRGNGVFLSASADEMYGQIMAQPDEMIEVLYINNTRFPLEEKDNLLSKGPKSAKSMVAEEIVKMFYGKDSAKKAAENFDRVFSKKELPSNINEFSGSGDRLTDFLVKNGLASSKSEAKQLFEQGAIEINGEQAKLRGDWNYELSSGDIIQVGPRKFAKVK